MMFKLCTACRAVNDAEATRCEDCGAALHGGDPVATAPPPVELTLRDLPPPQPSGKAQQRAGGARAGGTATDWAEPQLALPTLQDELPPADPPAAQSAGPVAPEPQTSAARTEARAARRAEVRRARLQASASGSASAIGDFVPEVLVVDRDALARETLSSLLRLFGFGVIGVADVGRAAVLLSERPFTAVFADIALDGGDGGIGIEFCRRLHEATTPSVLVLVSAPLNAVDRVRAQMLGFNGILPKPAQRGDVARVLDAHGVALPSDARRH